MKPFPDGEFDVIYADPPWSYDSGTGHLDGKETPLTVGRHRTMYNGDGEPTKGAVWHYPTMSIAQLKELPVASLTARDCLMFMWVTNPHLDVGIDLGKHWGFDYKTVAFVWDKQAINPGYYTMSQCELCLVFKKRGGKIPRPRGARNIRQFVSEKRGAHSAKPAEVRRRIEEMFPSQRKIELFHRGKAPDGWTCWGDESVVGDLQKDS